MSDSPRQNPLDYNVKKLRGTRRHLSPHRGWRLWMIGNNWDQWGEDYWEEVTSK